MTALRIGLAGIAIGAFALGVPGMVPASGPGRGCALFAMLLPILGAGPMRGRWWHSACLAVAAMILVKIVAGQPQLGAAMRQSLIDLSVVVIAAWLASATTRSLRNFDAALAHVLQASEVGRARTFPAVERRLYRTVRRARAEHRPLSVLAMRIPSEVVAGRMNPLLEDATRALLPRYAQSRLVSLLRRHLAANETIARFDDCLIALLPSALDDRTDPLVERLKESARRELGVELRVGRASFPDEEVTLAGLIERAVAQVRDTEEAPAPAIVASVVPSWRTCEPTAVDPT
jgi:hypothetical protein